MVEMLSPLEPAYQLGAHGSREGGSQLTLAETRPGSIVQLAGWPGQADALRAIISEVAGLSLADAPGAGAVSETRAAFGFAPDRFLVVDQAEGLGDALKARVDLETGSVTDLSHGRTAIAVAGPKAEWVLSKLFAIDFSLAAFSVGDARSTTHHDVFTLIHRTAGDRFELYVYRSFARSFWTLLCHSAEEVGYTVE